MGLTKLEKFQGLMSPTFTPFDSKNEINYDLIEPYAKLLKSKGVEAFLVNGTSGEAVSMTLEERKKVTEKWHEVCKKFDILMMVQIAGCSFADVVELAKHAASLNVDGILCLPELFFKPKTVQKLVQYLKDISVYCQGIPLYYYHIPVFTDVDLPMASFMELARKEIPSFAGIKYTSGDLEKALGCLAQGQVWLGYDKILLGGLALGFTNGIMVSLNINPEVSLKIVEFMKKGKVVEALEQQNNLNAFLAAAIIKGGGDPVTSMKKAFNDEYKHMNLGSVRKPL